MAALASTSMIVRVRALRVTGTVNCTRSGQVRFVTRLQSKAMRAKRKISCMNMLYSG